MKNSPTGFTLIETLIALAVIMVSVAGPLFTADRAIVAAQTSRDQLIASYLAQEGIEYVRMMRDAEFLAAASSGGSNVSSTAWNNFLSGSDSASIAGCRTTTCTVDTAPGVPMGTGSGLSLRPCSGSACGALYLANGIYTQQNSSGTVTPFTRTIQLIDVTSTDKLLVSQVNWSFHGIPYAVTITDHLTLWQ